MGCDEWGVSADAGGAFKVLCTVCRFLQMGRRLRRGPNDWTVKLWDVTSGECLQTLEGHSSDVLECVVFSRWFKKLRRGLGQDGEAVGCDEWGVSADAGGAFLIL